MQPVESRGNPIRSTAATRRVQFYGALFFNNYRFPRSRNSWPFSGPNIGASFGAGASARQLSGFGECRSGLIECSGRKMGCLFGTVFFGKNRFADLFLRGSLSSREARRTGEESPGRPNPSKSCPSNDQQSGRVQSDVPAPGRAALAGDVIVARSPICA